MSRLALLVGIDDYPEMPLSGCVSDALAMREALESHEDDSPNFETRVFRSDQDFISRKLLRGQAEELFERKDADVVVFYFAGHGYKHEKHGGFLVTQDFEHGDEGLTMSTLIGLANGSPAREAVIILDCCHAGAIDHLISFGLPVPLREGVSILAACRPEESAKETGGRGLFTTHVCDALDGGAADVRGFVSVPGIYAYVTEVLGGWEQRPLLRASLSKVTPLRRAGCSVSDDKLRKLAGWFPSVDHQFPLDPDFEPDSATPDPEKTKIFEVLQQMRAARLIEPVGNPHMHFAAMQHLSCQLTPLGQFYWRAVKARQI